MNSNSNDEKIARLEKENAALRQRETRRAVEEKGRQLLKKGNYILPDDPEIQKNYLDILFDKMEDENTRIVLDEEGLFLYDAEGNIKENEQGTRIITFEDRLNELAPKFFKKSSVPSSSNGQPKRDFFPKKMDQDIPPIKTADDWYQAIRECPTPEIRRALHDMLPRLKEAGLFDDKLDPAKEREKQRIKEQYFSELSAANRNKEEMEAAKAKYEGLMSKL